MNIKLGLIQKLPKAELHCHLDGSLRVKSIIQLAQNQNIDLPSKNINDLSKILSVGSNSISLKDYINKFNVTLSVLQTPESLERVAFELAMDCSLDGVKYLEVRYSPILHINKDMKIPDTIDAVKKGLDKASNECGIITGIIICGIRHISPSNSIKLANLAIQYKNKGVIGFDLAGAEKNFPAKDHIKAFELILKNNINTTLHAGEDFGPESIHQAIHICGAHRIGHGTRLHENNDLLNYVNDHRIPLEMCITSNIHTKSVSSIEKHPFKKYYDNKLRVTLNTDNRLISNTTLSKEYHLAINTFDLSMHDVRNIIINGFKSAFLPHKKRQIMIKKVIDELENEFGFEKRFID